MKLKKSFLKRGLSALLVITMLVSTLNLGLAVVSHADNTSVKLSEVIVDNYADALTSAEKLIIKSGSIAGDNDVVYEAPTDPTLIQIDPENRTVALGDYTGWTASDIVTIDYAGGSETLDLNDSNAFAYTGNAYTVSADYTYNVDVAQTAQLLFLNAPYAFAKSFNSLETVMTNATIANGLAQIEAYPELIQALADNGYEEAQDLIDEITANGGKTTLTTMIEAYNASHDTDMGYLAANESALADEAVFTASIVAEVYQAVCDNDYLAYIFGQTTYDLVKGALNNLTAALAPVSQAADWPLVSNYLATGLTNSAYTVLDTYVNEYRQGTISERSAADLIGATLPVTRATVQRSINRHSLTVVVTANVITADDTATTTPITKTTTVNLDDTCTKADVLAQVETAKTAALVDLIDYDVDDVNYTLATSDIDALMPNDALESNITYTVEYTPITLNIVTSGFSGFPATVPYGYGLTLAPLASYTEVYDYTVNGTYYDEGTVIRVTEDLTISRSVEKAFTKYYFGEVAITDYAPDNATAETILGHTDALDTAYTKLRTPTAEDNLVSSAANGSAAYDITAQDFAGTVDSSIMWEPYALTIVGGAQNGTVVPFNGNNTVTVNATDYDYVDVQYRAYIAGAFTDAQIVDALNLPATLVSDAASQEDAMNELTSILTSLGTVADLMPYLSLVQFESDDAKDAISAIINGCVKSNDLILNTYKAEYAEGGLYAYYLLQNANQTLVSDQVGILVDNLPFVVADTTFESLLRTYAETIEGMTDQNQIDAFVADKTEDVNEFINRLAAVRTELVPANAAVKVDNKSALKLLADDVDAALAQGYNTTYTDAAIVDNAYVATNLYLDREDRASIALQLKVFGSNGALKTLVPAAADARDYVVTYELGHVLTSTDYAILESKLADLVSAAGVGSYYAADGSTQLPAVGTSLDTAYTYTFIYAPRQITVDIVDEGGITVDTLSFYTDNSYVTLPSYDNSASTGIFAYEYTLGPNVYADGQTVDFLPFVGADDTIVVEQSVRNITEENVVAFIKELNDTIYNRGERNTHDQYFSFVPLDDGTDITTIVFRASFQSETSGLAKLLADVVTTIFQSDFDSIAINGEPIYQKTNDGVKLYAQAILDYITSMDVDLYSITDGDIFDENGNINEMDPGALSVYTYDISSHPSFVNTSRDSLGGKVNTSVITIDGQDYDLIFTLETFGIQSGMDRLANLYDMAEGLEEYVNISLANKALGIDITLTDGQYQAVVAAMLEAGVITLDDVNALTEKDILDYIYDVIDPVISSADFTKTTLKNTLAKLGLSTSIVDDNGKYIDLLIDTYQKYRSGLTYVSTQVGDHVEVNATVDIDPILDELNAEANNVLDVQNIVYEYYTGVDLQLNVSCDQYDYVAAILDADKLSDSIADGIQFVTAARLANRVANASDSSIVILLDDISAISLNGNTLDLNGHSVDTITLSRDALVMDSTFGGNATVGTVQGQGRVVAGTYTNIADALIPDGYVNEGGQIVGEYYTIAKDAQGNVEFTIRAANILNSDGEFDMDKNAMGLELAFGLLLNEFATSAIYVDNNKVYDASLDQIVDLIAVLKDQGAAGLDTRMDDILAWVDGTELTTIVNLILADVVDFPAIQAALESDGVLGQYSVDKYLFDIEATIDPTDYVELSIAKDTATKATTTLTIKVEDDAAQSVDNLVAELNAVNTQIGASAIVNDPTYASKTVNEKVSANLNYYMDVSTNHDYVGIIATIIAADDTLSNRADWIDAAEEYFTNGNIAKFDNLFNAATINSFINGTKAIANDGYAAVLADEGLTSVVSASALALEDAYDGFITLIGKIMDLHDISSSDVFGSYRQNFGEYATTDNVTKNASAKAGDYTAKLLLDAFNADVTVILYNESPVKVVDTNNEIVYMDDDIQAAFELAEQDYTVIVSDNVTLSADVDIDTQITVQGANFITFDNASLVLTDYDSKITSDDALTVTTNITGCTVDATNYVYTVEDHVSVVKNVFPDNTYAKYTSLEDALAAATDGTTVILLQDITGEGDLDVTADIVLDLAGFEISYDARYAILNVASDKTLEITSSVAGGTMSNAFDHNNAGVIACDDATASVVVNSADVTLTKTNRGYLISDGDLTITAGFFSGAIDATTGNISGGYFVEEPDSSLLANRYVAKAIDYVPGYNYTVVQGYLVTVTSRVQGTTTTVAPVTGGGLYPYGASVTITATAASGFTFLGWYTMDNDVISDTAVTTNLSYTFTMGNADVSYVALYEVTGVLRLQVTAPGFEYKNDNMADFSPLQTSLNQLYPANLGFTIDYDGPANTFFKSWINSSGKIVSTDADDYSFILVCNTKLDALYKNTDPTDPPSAFVAFVSLSNQLLSSETYETISASNIPTAPVLLGRDFIGWKIVETDEVVSNADLPTKVNSLILGNEKYITLQAQYSQPVGTYTITMQQAYAASNDIDGASVSDWTLGQSTSILASMNKYETLEAPLSAGSYSFAGFATEENGIAALLGNDTTIRYRNDQNVTIYAVFTTGVVEAKPVVKMTMGNCTAVDGGKYVTSFTAARDIPSEYKVLEQGILYGSAARLGTDLPTIATELVVDSPVAFTYKSNGLKNVDTTTLTIKGITSTTQTVYARGYVFYQNTTTGDIGVVYTGIAYGNYNDGFVLNYTPALGD